MRVVIGIGDYVVPPWRYPTSRAAPTRRRIHRRHRGNLGTSRANKVEGNSLAITASTKAEAQAKGRDMARKAKVETVAVHGFGFGGQNAVTILRKVA